ncbi:integron [Tianweitania populi]|nr:integron [Tianweitania populi]
MFEAGFIRSRGACAALALLFLCASLAAAKAESATPSVPVTASSDGIMDACNSVGRVTGLDPKGDNFLSVRSGPGGKYTEIARLASGADIFICDERSPWLGVIYPADDATVDCGTDAYSGEAKPYTGPCRSGWIHQKFVQVIAG